MWHSRPRLWLWTLLLKPRVTLWIPVHSALPCGSLVHFMYRRNLPHFQVDDTPVFVTFRTYKDFVLPPEARDLAYQHCLHDHMVLVHMHSFVIMPTHVHLLFTPLRDKDGQSFRLAKIMNGIKGASAHSINKLLARSGHLWQDESFDHVIESDEEMNNRLFYILTNPIDAGLCKYPEDYRWLWRE